MTATRREADRRRFLMGAIGAGLAGALPAATKAADGRSPNTVSGRNKDGGKPRSQGGTKMLDQAIRDVVIANRILAHEGVVDAYGHVSLRHPEDPDRFLLSRSRSPALVEVDDIMEFRLDGTPVDARGRHPYLERFIHGSIYQARPDVRAVVHSHAPEVLPYTITSAPLRPVIHSAGMIGAHVPVWDLRTRFGDTNLLVVNSEQGADLAAALANNNVVLMRGHGFAAAGRNLMEALRIAVYLRLNAAVLTEATRLGEVTGLSDGEIAKISDVSPDAPEVKRAWEYWATRAGCADLLEAAK